MIYFPKSRYPLSTEMKVAVGAQILAEGSALVSSTIAGAFGVKPATDDTTGSFVGFSVSEQITLASLPKVENFDVTGADGTTLVLSRTPSASTVFVYNNTSGSALAETTDWTVAGDVLTWVTDQSGDNVDVFYRFVPSAVEAQAFQGDVKPGGAAGFLLDQVGVIQRGVIYTSEFDTSVNWLATNPVIKTGVGGRVTIGGGGLTIPGVVVSAPNSGGPDGAFLGIEFNAGV
jgi:hypothetical protein